jgi:hypothetical protein
MAYEIPADLLDENIAMVGSMAILFEALFECNNQGLWQTVLENTQCSRLRSFCR